MGAVYATIEDIRAFGYPLSASQETAANTLLSLSSAKLRTQARNVGKDVDALIADPLTGEDYALAVKSVVVQAVWRVLDSANHSENCGITQGSQTLGAYSVQQTFFNPGQSLYFLRNELKDLGLYRSQTFGALDLYETEDDDVHE
jgi:hypothetical protein